jgi:Zinc carboxypeptidase/Cytosolic carboxypeptidase N-terminal domain
MISVPKLARLAPAKTPSRARGLWPAVLAVAALTFLMTSLLLWQRLGFNMQKTVSGTGNEPAGSQAVPSTGNATDEAVAVDANATDVTGAQSALKVVTNFEGGSARVLALDPETQTIRITPGGNPARGWPCWWYFQLKGIDVTRPLVLQVRANTAMVVAEGRDGEQKLGADWSLPSQAAISTDGVDWEKTPSGDRHGSEMTYHIQPTAPNLWLAWGPPFTLNDASNFVRQAAHDHSCAKDFTLTRSLENRPVPALRVSEGDLPESRRPVIWVIGRQHAWEVGGTWVCIGFAEWLLSDDPRAARLRSQAEIFIVPVMDSDRVATGDGGKDSVPHDHNRDWGDTPHYPEVAAVEKHILILSKENRMALLVDVHDPSLKARQSQLWVTPTNFLSVVTAQNQQRFIEAAFQEIQGPIPTTHKLVWDGPAPNSEWWHSEWHHLSCPWIYEHSNPENVAVTLEVPWNAPASTIDDYRSVGQGLGRAIELYMRETPSWKTLAGSILGP